jgi:transitional endoplasmic reticulum ATPase
VKGSEIAEKGGNVSPVSSIDSSSYANIVSMVVVDIDPYYYGKGRAVITPQMGNQLQIKEGDVIKIQGEKHSFAICEFMPSSEAYIDSVTNLHPIQMDSNTRKNCGVVLGDIVKISKYITFEAEHIYLVEVEGSETDSIHPNIERLKRFLQDHVVQKGDEVWIPSRDVSSLLYTTDQSKPTEDFKYFNDMYYMVFHTAPVGRDYECVRITNKTDIIIREKPVINLQTLFDQKVYLSDIGGLKEQKRQLKELIGFKIYQSKVLEESRLNFANAILLTGPSGTGKTMLMKAMLNEFPVCSYYINGPEIIGDKPQSTPQELGKIFDEAIKSAPSIIAVDEIEALAFNREDLKFDAIMRNIITQFLQLMDRIAQTHDVILIGTTNKPNTIDTSFRTTSRFSKEIAIPTPDEKARKEILEILVGKSPLLDQKLIDCKKIAEEANGFSGADLNLLVQEAFVENLKELGLYDQFISRPLDPNLIRSKLKVGTQNFLTVLKEKRVKPSLLRTYFVETPKVRFSDVGGLTEAKRLLEENIKFPRIYPELYQKFGGRMTKGIMLYGPPGCGKTLLAKALAAETNMNFIYIKAAEVLNRWLGESEAAIREIFTRARSATPCIVFFDELDAISTVRGVEGNVHSDRVTAQILTELDGLEELKDIICIGATNRLDIIDPAIMRPGRLYPTVEIGIPNDVDRVEILKIHTRKIPLDPSFSLSELASLTKDMSGANLEEICHRAATFAIRESIEALEKNGQKIAPTSVLKSHFISAIKEVTEKTNKTHAKPAHFYT